MWWMGWMGWMGWMAGGARYSPSGVFGCLWGRGWVGWVRVLAWRDACQGARVGLGWEVFLQARPQEELLRAGCGRFNSPAPRLSGFARSAPRTGVSLVGRVGVGVGVWASQCRPGLPYVGAIALAPRVFLGAFVRNSELVSRGA